MIKYYFWLSLTGILIVAQNAMAENVPPTLIKTEQDIIGPLALFLLIGYALIKLLKRTQSPIVNMISPSGAGLALLCFFLPWMEVSCVGQTKTISGADIGGEFWIVFIAALVALGAYLYFKNLNMLKTAQPIITLASLVGIGFLMYKLLKVNSGVDTGFGKLTLADFGFKPQIGIYGTVLGFLMSLLGSIELSNGISSKMVVSNKDIDNNTQHKFCTKCGQSVAIEYKACHNCGTLFK
ncbi:MAG: zinc ribbon domain-containing protein [Oryzomonas sp.]|uniref:zinc ribbon domain-containing protein n=1 Tax=Oryzomonas sp. TaxID=2855186 RepID=UPI002844CA2A|nr:zinc ribbon domain-containing protein [Oryzomonas sp.]MDR3580066.1 zinc ribbon domain-containing protein [Oryzomonas sp.]